ncbi:MAG: threonine-phosphate decarboxylase CobD [Candidatus Omnitrophica bacterium]|nr:threonine-phosphate decarboxylase CobD [Candidatus Omnitrophota bacterium]
MTDRIHGGNCLRRNIIDFSVNTNPLGLPKGLSGIISKNTDIILRYPDSSSERLKGRLAALHDIEPENIAIGNGSIELVYLVPRAFKIKKALIITPTFSEYEFAVRSNGSVPAFFNTCEKDDFKIDCGKLAEHLPRHDAFFLCNPNNPTGAILHSNDVLCLSRLSKKHNGLLILDEAFIEFTEESRNAAIISYAVKSGTLVILRSLTKFFAIPGLRLGYAIGHKRIIEKITKLQYPWNINSLAQLAGVKALTDKGYIDQTRLFVAKERQYMFEKLGNVKGLKVYPSSANFILCKLQSTPIYSSIELTQRLLRDGIYIRACGNFRGLNDKFFRVAVRRRDDNNLLINSIKKAFQ